MIPKIIHYSWFSGEPYPEDIQYCIDSWQKFLPDYELVLWDAEKLAALNNTFANEAVSVKKWAFASDFVRLYAVYTYGGIWLDTDVEVFKSFDPFLNHKLFIGRECNQSWHENNPSTVSLLTAHCFGAEAGHPFLKMCLDFYEKRHFIRSENTDYPEELRYDMLILPQLQTDLARRFWGFDWTLECDMLQELKDGIAVYPHDFFDRPKFNGMAKVVCIHRQMGGWRTNIHHNMFKSESEIYDSPGRVKRIKENMLIILNRILCRVGLKLIPISLK